MSARPIEAKQRHKVAKAFRQKLPARFDLIQWLIDHGHARTRREARKLILDKRVTANSHTLGVEKRVVTSGGIFGVPFKAELEDDVQQFISTSLRSDLVVLAA